MKLLRDDCVVAMRELDAESIDAVVTDPPYGLSFMGKPWDDLGELHEFQAWTERWAREALRVLKPGCYLLAFAGTRTYHRMASGVEDAGFEIRDCIAWMYGSGFPKSLDVSKAIDKGEGFWRGRAGALVSENGSMSAPNYERTPKGDPVTAAAAAWQGWGTALKPAFEPVVVARKPLIGTVAANVLAHGTGALNIDGCRIAGGDTTTRHNSSSSSSSSSSYMTGRVGETQPVQAEYVTGSEFGRWPANVILDADAAAMLDEQSGESSSSSSSMLLPLTPGDSRGVKHGDRGVFTVRGHDDSGGASRFFYVAKASRSERNAGLDGFEKALPDGRTEGTGFLVPGSHSTPRANVHPTVKPLDLMRHLVRLVTPPGGTVLDPFMGSGSTGCACALEGFDFVGIDRDDDGTYLPIAEARIAFWREHGEDGWRIVRERDAGDARREKVEESGQLSILDVETEDVAEEVAA